MRTCGKALASSSPMNRNRLLRLNRWKRSPKPMSTLTQHGYLVLADISGYTSFVAATELEHAHDILTELLELILGQLTPTLTLSKLEGDAVFAYAAEARVPRGETVLE